MQAVENRMNQANPKAEGDDLGQVRGNKHTPGPWTLSLDLDGTPYVATDRNRIADVYIRPMTESVPTEQGMANATLITAAPELLDALESLLTIVKGSASEHGVIEHTFGKAYAKKVATARAAIAKAKGG